MTLFPTSLLTTLQAQTRLTAIESDAIGPVRPRAQIAVSYSNTGDELGAECTRRSHDSLRFVAVVARIDRRGGDEAPLELAGMAKACSEGRIQTH